MNLILQANTKKLSVILNLKSYQALLFGCITASPSLCLFITHLKSFTHPIAVSVSLRLSYFISFHLLGNIDIVKTNYKKSSDLNLFLKVEYFLIELCIAVPHSPCGACIYSPFCLLPPLFSTHTHFEPALLQCTSIHSNQAILQLICQSFCSMLYSLRHVQTQQGNHISPACL